MTVPDLVCRDLSVRYFDRKAKALDGVNVAIAPGQRVLVTGPSGSGKSTLARCLSGLIPVSVDVDMQGHVEIGGVAVQRFNPGEVSRVVGMVFQDPSSQFTMLTVADEVAFGLENLGVLADEMESRVLAALEAVNLKDRADWKIDRLSGGQQQRVALAAALVMRPDVLVLDEPTAHLDPRAGADLYSRVRNLVDELGTTLIVVEHDADKVIPGIVDDMVTLDLEGRVLATDSTSIDDVFGEIGRAKHWAMHGMALPAHVALFAEMFPDEQCVRPTADAVAQAIASSVDAQRRLRSAGSKRELLIAGEPLVSVRDLHVGYHTPLGYHDVLKGIDLTVGGGEIVAIVGVNGSGKTTLLRTLSGLVTPRRGAVRMRGVDVQPGRCGLAPRSVAHVFQNPEHGFLADTVFKELSYGLMRSGWIEAQVNSRVESTMRRFGLTSVAFAHPYTLSGGQQRRLSVATALMREPKVLVLDEPTFGLDQRSAQLVIEELTVMRSSGTGIVMATHDVTLVSEHADRVVAIAEGRIVFDGLPGDFYADEQLLELVGQVVPALRQVLAAVNNAGALVPIDLRWGDISSARRTRAMVGGIS